MLQYYFAKFLKNHLIPKAIKNSQIDKTAKVCSGTSMLNSSLGKYSFVGHNCTVNDCKIGRYCSIGNDCIIGGSEHPVTWVSTSPVFHTNKNALGKSFSKNRFSVRKQTNIGNDVWLGTRVLLKSGVSIGDGAVVGMGSIVTKNIPSYEIWAGNPAKFIRKRFDDETISKLQNSKWWDYNETEIITLGDYFNNPDEFLKKTETV